MSIAKNLGITLSSYDEQTLRDAIISSHEIGRGQDGKNGQKAQIYQYTNKQL